MVGVCGSGAVGDGPFVGAGVVDGVVADGGDVFDCRSESRVGGEEQVRAFCFSCWKGGGVSRMDSADGDSQDPDRTVAVECRGP